MRYIICKGCGRRTAIDANSRAKYCSSRCRTSCSSNPNRYYHQGVYLTKGGRREVFQSSWEELHMRLLDEKGIKWCRASHIKIPYYNTVKGRTAYYVPDFVVWTKDGATIQELKPYSRVNDKTVQDKAEAARQWCLEHGYHYEIVCTPGYC